MRSCDLCGRPAENSIGRGLDGLRRCALCEAYRRYVTGEYSGYVQVLAIMQLAAMLDENDAAPSSGEDKYGKP